MRTAAHRLELAIAALPGREASYAVLRFGMDDFRLVNETFGVTHGDLVLEQVQERLQSAVREHELVLRLPGDEFAVLLCSPLSAVKAEAAGERLRNVLLADFLVCGEAIALSACVGIALAPEDGKTAEALLARAGNALQCAKTAGTGMVQVFDSTMETDGKRRQELLLDLRKALLLNQLELHYQPQLHSRSGAVIGVEALMRWRHPHLGVMAPRDFLPLAEEVGLMGVIGEWALREACQEAARLPAHLTMAVNVAPAQFQGQNYFRSVAGALERAGLPGPRLEVEVTEGLLLSNEQGVIPVLHDLRGLGVQLAMDDFGTGYSSLGRLTRLPFDRVKIDRSLVGGGVRQRAVVRAVATLGRGFGISTLAEGIETEAQCGWARADGCDAVQGYYFSKAVPAEELGDTLRRLRAFAQPLALGA